MLKKAPDIFPAVLTVGFGTTVAMWAVGYLGRLPAVLFSGPVLLGLLLTCLLAGGFLAGRYTSGGWRGGVYTGLVTGLLNLLVLGGLLTGERHNQIVPSVLLWVPGSIAVSAALGGLGAALGSRRVRGNGRPGVRWPAVFVRVAIVATLLLLAVGGLVTSKEAGLAVVDWPNSYGYNMFLYPLSRMTGGIYYEHAHRLFGALVGLTTLALAAYLQRVEPRRLVRRLAWLVFLMVVIQGVLGGLRVTGRFTLSTLAENMQPSLALAVVHGVFAQVCFGALVALGAFTSATWQSDRPATSRGGARADRILGWTLIGVLLVQLVLGAIQRHADSLLILHIAMAAVVAPLALHVGFRTWGLNPKESLLQRLGIGLAGVTFLQLLLGIGAFMAIGGLERSAAPTTTDVTVTTAHQWCGAILLACAVLVLCWNHRLVTTNPLHR